MPLLRIFTIGLSLTLFQAHAKNIEQYQHYLPVGANIAVIVQPVNTDKTFVDYNSRLMMLPASTQKVITALASMLELGKDYRFKTTFESKGKIQNNILQGDLIARFTGDPSLTRKRISLMIKQLKSRGINRISGNLIVDTSIFASHDRPSGWSWNNNTHCYSAPPGAAVIDQNCFYVKLEPTTKSGELIKANVLSGYPVTLTSEARAFTPKAKEARYCEFDIIAKDNNQFTLTGCLAQQKQPVTLSFAIQDSALYAGQVIRNELSQAGIKLNGQIRITAQPDNMTILASTQSEPLSTLLTTMLKRSDNITADTLFRVLGHRYTGTPGTWRSGGIAVKQILSKKAGIDLQNSVIADGSGLSRQNLISAYVMMQILQYIAANDNQLGLINMLPISGLDGTLQKRKGLKDAGLDGMVYAKTGALSDVYNLAGFIKTHSGKQLAFVQLISGYSPSDNSKKHSLNLFEMNFYRELYTNH